MTAELPPPPVPPDADLTDFKFMPLEVARLRRSKAWLICKRRPELAFYMLNLWTASWHERPAGSLEDDDDVLADAAMCSPEKWPKVRGEVMRGWVKHFDGRLYHPVVAEKVNDSWHGRVISRWERECDRIRKENHRRKEKHLPPLDFPPKPERISATVPEDGGRMSGGIPPENALKGERREREKEGKEEEDSAAADSSTDTARAQASGIPVETPQAAMKARAAQDAALVAWNETADRHGLSRVDFLTSTRRFRLDRIFAISGGIEGWKAALDHAPTQAYLRTANDGWQPWFKFDWLLDEDHFAKLMEGNYAQRRSDKTNGQSSHASQRAALAEWSREGDS